MPKLIQRLLDFKINPISNIIGGSASISGILIILIIIIILAHLAYVLISCDFAGLLLNAHHNKKIPLPKQNSIWVEKFMPLNNRPQLNVNSVGQLHRGPTRREIMAYNVCTVLVYWAFQHANSTQSTVAFFTAVNHLNRLLRKQKFTLMGSKGHVQVGCDW